MVGKLNCYLPPAVKISFFIYIEAQIRQTICFFSWWEFRLALRHCKHVIKIALLQYQLLNGGKIRWISISFDFNKKFKKSSKKFVEYIYQALFDLSSQKDVQWSTYNEAPVTGDFASLRVTRWIKLNIFFYYNQMD